jgi:hypothetical protein
MSSLAIEKVTGYDMLFPQRSEAMTRAVITSATQRHLLWPRQITEAQYRHEQAMLPKQVPSTSEHFFTNYRQKRPGRSIGIALYIQNSIHHPSVKVNSIRRGNYWGASVWI